MGLFWKDKSGVETPVEIVPPEANAPVADAPVVDPVVVAPVAAAPAAAPIATSPVADPQAAAKDAEIVQLRQRLAAEQVNTITAKAEGWYEKLFAGRKIVPAEKADAVGAFVQASLDDLVSPKQTGKSRVALLAGIFDARTAHTLTTPRLGADGKLEGAPDLPPGFRVVESTADADAGARFAGVAEAKLVPEAKVKEALQMLVDAGQYGSQILNGANVK